MMSTTALLLLAVIMSAMQASVRAACADPISCFLLSQSFPIPEIEKKILFINMKIEGMVCNGINIGGIPTTYNPAQPTNIHLEIQDIQATCSGHYKFGAMGGTITASVHGVTVAGDLDLHKTGELPTSLTIPNCHISSFHSHITFSGNVGNKILNVMDPLIETVLKGEINKLACEMGMAQGAANATWSLQNVVDPLLLKFIHSKPTPVPKFNFPTLNFKYMWDQILNNEYYLKVKNCAHSTGFIPDDLTRPYINFGIDKVTGGTGQITVPVWMNVPVKINGTMVTGTNGEVTIETVTISGLNSFSDIEVLGPVPGKNQTVRTRVGLKELQFLVKVVTYAAHPEGYSDDLSFTLRVEDLDFIMDLTAAVDPDVMAKFYVDQMMSPGCMIQAVKYLNVTSMTLNTAIKTIHLVQTGGDAAKLEMDMITFSDNIFSLLLTGFPNLITDTMAGMFQGPIRAKMNEAINKGFNESKSTHTCTPHDKDIGKKTDDLVWADNIFITAATDFINKPIGVEMMNKGIKCLANGTGSVAFGNASQTVMGIPLPWHVEIANMDSLYNMSLLKTYSKNDPDTFKPYNLLDGFGIGNCPVYPSENCKPLTVHANFKTPKLPFLEDRLKDIASLTGPAPNANTSNMLRGEATSSPPSAYDDIPDLMEEIKGILPWFENYTDIMLYIRNFSVYTDVIAKVNKDAVLALTQPQLRTKGCMETAATGVADEVLDMFVGTSTAVVDNGKIEFDFTKTLHKLIPFASKVGKVVMNQQIQKMLEMAGPTCENGGVTPHSTPSDAPTTDEKKFPYGTAIAFLVGLVFLVLIYYVCLRKTPDKDEEPERYEAEKEYYFDKNLSCWKRMHRFFEDALIRNTAAPRIWRYGLLVSIILNIGMFVWSNSSVGVQVQAVVHIFSQEFPEKTINPPSLFDFSLRSSVDDMWQAKVYPLAIMIAFFSGAWPYLKLLSMGACLVMPVRRLSLETREYILQTMDILGKWSLIDFIVLTLFMCAFYFNLVLINPEPVEPQYVEKIVINSYVVPQWGIYSFIIATVGSLINGHLTLGLHRQTEPKYQIPPIAKEHDKEESLCSHVYTIRTHLLPKNARDPLLKNLKVKVRTTIRGTVCAFIVLLGSCIMVYAGTIIETFQFEIKGATGWLLGEDAITQYNIVKVGEKVPDGSGSPNDPGVRIIQGFFFAFGIAMPALVHVFLFVLWFVPMRTARQNLVFVFTEVVNAWTAIDVFCVAIGACLAEIRQLSAFIIGGRCDLINTYLAEFMDNVLDGDDKCFDVVATLLPMCWTLFLAAVSCSAVAIPTIAICHQCVEERREVAQELHALQDGGVYSILEGSEEEVEEARSRDPSVKERTLTGESAIEDIVKKKKRAKTLSQSSDVMNPLTAGVVGEQNARMEQEHKKKKKGRIARCIAGFQVFCVRSAIYCGFAEVLPDKEAAAADVNTPFRASDTNEPFVE